MKHFSLRERRIPMLGCALVLVIAACATVPQEGDSTARMGGEILLTLLWFVLTVLVGLGLQMFVVYPIALWTIARRSPWQFFRDVREAIVTAFGTSSSNATLPTALKVAYENLKLPKEISRFVLTVGSTANQNGTALYEGVVVLFLAQVYGADLTGTLITIFPVTDDTVFQSSLGKKDEGKWRLEVNKDIVPKEGTAVKLIIQAK